MVDIYVLAAMDINVWALCLAILYPPVVFTITNNKKCCK